ncbi:MAG: hypothetical protein AAGC46_12650 [Solirubrobacteraceae bacterium]|nr:hypothetical protein [Patulibacter sp.]
MFPTASRALVAGLATLGLTATVATTTASAAAPTKWTVSFNDYVPRSTQDAYPDYVYVQAADGTLPEGVHGTLRLDRNGSTIARGYGWSRSSGEVDLPDLQPGDVATFYDAISGTVYATATYDGRPAFDPATACVGSKTFAGLRTGNALVTDLYAYRWAPRNSTPGYGSSSTRLIRTDINNGTLSTLSGEAFTGTFERPLAAGAIVAASSTYLASPSLTVYASTERTVGGCPPPPAPQVVQSAPLKDTVAPKATITATTKHAKSLTLKKLASPGLSFSVTSNEAGTVTAVLNLSTPSKKKSKPAKVVSLSTVTAPITAGKPLSVLLAVTKKQKKQIAKAGRKSSLVAHVTVTDAAGNVATLGDLTYKAPRS